MKTGSNGSTVAIMLLLIIFLPLVGIWLAGKNISYYLEFPPMTRYVSHAGFSWPVFSGMAIAIVAVIMLFKIRVLTSRRSLKKKSFAVYPFPWWGWMSILMGLAAWVLAWTRFNWMEPFQLYTFTPLWFAYIVFINALTYRRTGMCMLKDRTGYFCLLFLVSAAFWWFFEYLNRFVQNWYYVEARDLTKIEYFLLATLPFSTVLPAVLSTSELLKSIPRVGNGLNDFIRIRVKKPQTLASITLVVSSLGLAGIGVWPNFLFPLLWLAPLLIITSIQALREQDTIFSYIKDGNWTRLYRLGLAALICGFFWEMWNFFSLSKWVYEVPFVSRFRLFEMPILGYVGYLPFGLECAVIGGILSNALSKHKSRMP